MRVSVIRNGSIRDFIFPNEAKGSYWIDGFDINGNKRNIILIDSDNGKWKLVSNNNAYVVVNDVMKPFVYLDNYNFYKVKNEYDKDTFLIYVSPVVEQYNCYEINEQLEKGFSIGKSGKCLIKYSVCKDVECYIKKENDKIYVINNEGNVYVNNVRLFNKVELKIGDIIFINGLRIIINGNDDHGVSYSLYVNNINLNDVKLDILPTGIIPSKYGEFTISNDDNYYPIYNENDYFYKKPRIVPMLKTLDINVDEPPAKFENKESPFLLTIGPMITMSMTSLMMGYNTLNGVNSGTMTMKDATPSLIICGAMFASIFIWPLMTRFYEKFETGRKERKRQKKYNKYIDSKIEEISKAKNEQTSILKMHYLSSEEASDVILNRSSIMWQRRVTDDDYLTVNLGTGNCPMKININYPEEKFTLEEDNLKKLVERLGSEPKILENVPIPYSLKTNYISGIIGNDYLYAYVKKLIIQILAFHSYDDLKIVVLTDEEHEHEWAFLRLAPHLFSDDKSIRFFATNNDEYKEICYYLNRIYEERKNNKEKNFEQLYLIITDSFKKIREIDFIKNVLENEYNGFSFFMMDRKMTNFPDQCTSFIDLSLITSNNFMGEVKNNLDINNSLQFNIDFSYVIDYEKCVGVLANTPIDIKSDNEGKLPLKIGFLEMYDVGRVEQLNSPARWSSNNPVLNLSAPVGVGRNGELITIDLHEKYHGPHGLIAGMTGSGKSEFIITYILSMALNYSPYEVQFILIDYKGGGLAGAFENKLTGVKLPHLVGTITNLDANEIKRSLASIESELKRRQALFNKAREISGESTVDIYKYQKMFRQGILTDPVSHLFIICDEFAELKNQQPEFMEQLISTARIGRSLGVHLILATQKPSGVVDPQIWSNTRFRVCLRVQDTSDSNEVIKKDDAAFLKQTGRFYFQVGYDEVFTIGQAAYAGGTYVPSDNIKKDVDSSVDFINNIGYVTRKVDTKPKVNAVANNNGEELSNIVKYLSNLAKEQNIKCKQLWMPKLPPIILVDSLREKYSFKKNDFILNPIIGEYDVPSKQEQNVLTVPLTENGNVLIYGAAGSGKENFIMTMLYSFMNDYSSSEVSTYIIDFGSGALNSFNDSAIVGDIISGYDEERIENLYKMLNATINERKKLFANFGGSFVNYIKNSNRKISNIVVIINNYEAYIEAYDKYSDTLNSITRECYKYGIYFVLTVNTPNGVRFRLRQNFSLIYALNQNNEDDFSSIINGFRRNYPAKNFGRGIVKIDDIYEFQSAVISDTNMNEAIANKISTFNKNNFKVKKIPVLPEIVDKNSVSTVLNKTSDIAIGINKNSLNISTFDFKKNIINLISTLDLLSIDKFINPLINQIIFKQNRKLIVINSTDFKVNEDSRKYYQYVDGSFDDFAGKLCNYINDLYNMYKDNNYNRDFLSNIKPIYCMIIGIDDLMSKLSIDNKRIFEDMFTKCKDLDIINFIIVDSVDKIRKVESESWYRNNINKSFGIWLGNGINEQYSINISQKVANMRDDVPNNFCFVINRGKAEYVKYVESFDLNSK